jgi:hypothetical protein
MSYANNTAAMAEAKRGDMDGTDLIIDALAAGVASGAAASVKSTADAAVIRAYHALTSALRRAFGRHHALSIDGGDELAAYERGQQRSEELLRQKISVAKAYLDDEVTNAALRLLQLARAAQSASGWSDDTHIAVSDSQGVQVNTGQAEGFQHNIFRS